MVISSEERALRNLEQQIVGATGNANITIHNLQRIKLDTLKYGIDANLIGTIEDKLGKIVNDLDNFYIRIRKKKLDLIS